MEESYYELYDLENDRGETNNIVEHNAQVTEDLKQKLHHWIRKKES